MIIIPLALFVSFVAVVVFKAWSKKMTRKMNQKYGGSGQGGIAVKQFGITLFLMPYNSQTSGMTSYQ